MRYLRDSEVASLVGFVEAADTIEQAFRDQAEGKVALQARVRTLGEWGKLSVLGAVDGAASVAGAKVYTTAPDGRFSFTMVLIDPQQAQWLAVMEGASLTRIRTAAASLMAARHLARADSSRLVVFGSGVQAAAHAHALAAVFPLEEIRLVTRRPAPDRLAAIAEGTGVAVVAADDPDQAVAWADLVVTATRSVVPLFDGRALRHGAHVTSVGATQAGHRELDDVTVAAAGVVAVESREQARLEAGNLIGTGVDWDRVIELADLVSGMVEGRVEVDQITLYDSLGVGLEDVAVAHRIYRRALERGVGTELPTDA